ncbi:MAG: hypothetical protein QG622_3372 [Actinomycetota bacterium]|nr:hypothetical protein [Actinomycetota bacterium]
MIGGGVVAVLALGTVAVATTLALRPPAGGTSASRSLTDPPAGSATQNPATANPAVASPAPENSATENSAPESPLTPGANPEPAASIISMTPSAQPSPQLWSSVALSAGDCIQSLPGGRDSILTVLLVDCTQAHEAQVGATFSPTGGPYPGDGTLEEIVRTQCPVRLGPSIAANAPPLSWTGYYPEAEEWDLGDHSIKCLVVNRDGTPLTRSVII